MTLICGKGYAMRLSEFEIAIMKGKLGAREEQSQCSDAPQMILLGFKEQKRNRYRSWIDSGYEVPTTGFEPARPFEHHPLKMACLPISPRGPSVLESANIVSFLLTVKPNRQ